MLNRNSRRAHDIHDISGNVQTRKGSSVVKTSCGRLNSERSEPNGEAKDGRCERSEQLQFPLPAPELEVEVTDAKQPQIPSTSSIKNFMEVKKFYYKLQLNNLEGFPSG
jgi:hypothetical protein